MYRARGSLNNTIFIAGHSQTMWTRLGEGESWKCSHVCSQERGFNLRMCNNFWSNLKIHVGKNRIVQGPPVKLFHPICWFIFYVHCNKSSLWTLCQNVIGTQTNRDSCKNKISGLACKKITHCLLVKLCPK